ncbi:MAG: DUF4430 domain-containing protein [Solirubrobacterales bacterium]|nr:DUF4430 domain-containing protein [Solirubrobacterales bacterium]
MASRRGTKLAATVALAAAVAGGCGVGAGKGTSDVTLTVTRAFGSAEIASITRSKVPGSETVMRALERSFQVQTRYGGGFVESIDGRAGDSSRRDWFYYVNGIEAPRGAATTAVHRGDRIWWDLHDWSATDSVPAVVGSYPEPFVHGAGGRRFPTTIECASNVSAPCKRVTAQLNSAGVPVSSQLLGTGSGQDTLTVLVGTWSDLRAAIAGSLIERGPSASGVYARFGGPDGRSLQLLDPSGRAVRTLGAGAGLIAATGDRGSTPAWLITGTDVAGVSAAAAAMTPTRLRDHFALAVQGSADLPIPLDGGA